ncbi:MAG: hypothetical protein GY883_23245, partial [Shimia sp.]|nr:hypothetical protein [Shimia sp.]
MKPAFITTLALSCAASALHAGGIDRSGQGVNILFEEGNFAQISLINLNPSVDGKGTGDGMGDHNNAAQSYTDPSLGYKHKVNDVLDIAFIYDQPFGAHIAYTNGLLAGGGADITSDSITGLARYKLSNGLSVYGGLRGVKAGGTLTSSHGMLQADSGYAMGGVVGMAYEKPEIALRAALTYASGITTEMQGFHNVAAARNFDVDFPESVNLDFQTGIAADTLLFGSVRWVGWEGFN